MKSRTSNLLLLLAFIGSAGTLTNNSKADPLPGQVPKFAQQPMINTTIGTQIYYGHDELSTAYGVGNAANPPASYRGTFMADDFADKFSTPVVHITWWGSYMNNTTAAPQPAVQKFLIAFESDKPVGPGQPYSTPDQVLQYEVVTPGPLSPGSGTFTETLVRGPDPVLGEALFRYNAELHLPFNQLPDTVYWLKIAALVDSPTPILVPIPPNVTQWGWHNRDYTINDPLASTSPAVIPGEFLSNIAGTTIPVWHFQDDAVQGNLDFFVNPPVGTPNINQTQMVPTNYQFFNSTGVVGPIDGPAGIELHSKDLAFRLFTTPIPEPATCMLMAIGLAGVVATRRRSRIA